MVEEEDCLRDASLKSGVCQTSHVFISSRQDDQILTAAKCVGLGNIDAKDEETKI